MNSGGKTFFFLATVLWIAFHSCHSQPASLTLYSLTESNGLSDNRVTTVFQDHRGFMWIGTEDGLNRYDGSVFTIFKKRKNDSTELADNYIRALAEDWQHHLWIGTQHGLSEYDLGANIFRTYQCNLSVKDINVMMDIWPDNKGNIWIGTLGGLLQFIPSQNKFIPYFIPSNKISDNRISDILVDKKNQFWVAAQSGLWRFSPDSGNFKRVLLNKKNYDLSGAVNALFQSHDGKLWVGCWNSGLIRVDPETGENKVIVQPALRSNVQGITELSSAQGHYDIWCSDLFRIEEEGKITQYAIRVNPPSSNYHVGKLYNSKEGLLWLCSDKGVMIMDPMKQFFHHYNFPQQITHQGIAFQKKEKNIYVAGAGRNFLKLYDSTFHLIRSYSFSKKDFPEIHGNPALLSITREDENHLWLCTEEGLVLMDERNGTQQLYRLTEKECQVPTRNFISTLFIDSRHNHWVFPWRGGIWQFDPLKKEFKKSIEGLIQESGHIKGLVISEAAEDDLGNLWFADLDEGLIQFNRTTQVFSAPTDKYFGERYSLTNVFYERPYLWGSANGIVFRIHERTLATESWIIPEELNKTVTGFCNDEQNHIWITTRNGLLSFDKSSHQFKNFTVNDGLNDNMLTGTIFRLDKRRIIYGDENYLTVFNPQELVKLTSVPPVLITNVLSQNQSLDIQTNGKQEKYIELDYSHNNFTFYWAILHYSNPLQNRYYCKLEGVDRDWKYIGNTGRVQYASLAPGRYQFHAKGATSDGIMNNTGDTIVIIIRPPFWKSWWFFLVCGAGFIGITYSWYRYRLNEVVKTERLRNKISGDLHDEIGSTLSSISIMSDLVAQRTNEEKTVEVANEIRENAIVLMERMDDIVWSINPKNDSLEDLLLRVKRFAAQLFEAKKIEYEIKIHPNVKQVKLPMEFRQNVYLILKEGINNLVKHASCTKANIELIQEQAMLNLTITDNGLGFDVGDTRFGNGINSMENRAAKMKMMLDIHSEKGKGTRVQLRIKIK